MKKTLIVLASILLTACSLLQSPTQPPPPVETTAPATEPSQEASATASPTLPAAPPGQVSGRVCYPSEFIPEMTAYFLETGSQTYTELSIAENQGDYSIDLLPGNYLAFAWVDDFQVGGGYTAYVACGYAESCTDHSLLQVSVDPGQTLTGIDLCDWILNDLPLPDGQPGGEPDGSADELAGLVYRTPEGLWIVDPDGTHRMLLDRPDAIILSAETFVYAEGDDLWLLDVASGQPVNLTNTPDRIETIWTGITQPAGSVLFSSYPVDFELGPGVTGFLSIVALDGSGYRVLDEENQTWHFNTSPDGSRVAYGLGDTGQILDLNTGERSAFDPADYGLEEVTSIGSPTFSPDGGRISWVVGFQSEDGQPFTFGLAVFDLAAGTGAILHPHEIPGMDGYPPAAVWRPDGEWLIYNAFDVDFTRGGAWLLQANGGAEIYLGQGSAAVWRPDGGGLVYLDTSTGSVRFFDPISLESTVLDFLNKNVQPVAWLP